MPDLGNVIKYSIKVLPLYNLFGPGLLIDFVFSEIKYLISHSFLFVFGGTQGFY
jgi:hypothetical protein